MKFTYSIKCLSFITALFFGEICFAQQSNLIKDYNTISQTFACAVVPEGYTGKIDQDNVFEQSFLIDRHNSDHQGDITKDYSYRVEDRYLSFPHLKFYYFPYNGNYFSWASNMRWGGSNVPDKDNPFYVDTREGKQIIQLISLDMQLARIPRGTRNLNNERNFTPVAMVKSHCEHHFEQEELQHLNEGSSLSNTSTWTENRQNMLPAMVNYNLVARFHYRDEPSNFIGIESVLKGDIDLKQNGSLIGRGGSIDLEDATFNHSISVENIYQSQAFTDEALKLYWWQFTAIPFFKNYKNSAFTDPGFYLSLNEEEKILLNWQLRTHQRVNEQSFKIKSSSVTVSEPGYEPWELPANRSLRITDEFGYEKASGTGSVSFTFDERIYVNNDVYQLKCSWWPKDLIIKSTNSNKGPLANQSCN
ncbi:hypothetical protein MRY82_02820 [bacterium]|nr:hypothetical protein [bacterium]